MKVLCLGRTKDQLKLVPARFMGSSVSPLERVGPMNLAVWSTTEPPEGGTLTGREPDNTADHAERPPARVPRLRGKARFMGSVDDKRVVTRRDHERGRRFMESLFVPVNTLCDLEPCGRALPRACGGRAGVVRGAARSRLARSACRNPQPWWRQVKPCLAVHGGRAESNHAFGAGNPMS